MHAASIQRSTMPLLRHQLSTNRSLISYVVVSQIEIRLELAVAVSREQNAEPQSPDFGDHYHHQVFSSTRPETLGSGCTLKSLAIRVFSAFCAAFMFFRKGSLAHLPAGCCCLAPP